MDLIAAEFEELGDHKTAAAIRHEAGVLRGLVEILKQEEEENV
jgi:hypothetical protein